MEAVVIGAIAIFLLGLCACGLFFIVLGMTLENWGESWHQTIASLILLFVTGVVGISFTTASVFGFFHLKELAELCLKK